MDPIMPGAQDYEVLSDSGKGYSSKLFVYEDR